MSVHLTQRLPDGAVALMTVVFVPSATNCIHWRLSLRLALFLKLKYRLWSEYFSWLIVAFTVNESLISQFGIKCVLKTTQICPSYKSTFQIDYNVLNVLNCVDLTARPECHLL